MIRRLLPALVVFALAAVGSAQTITVAVLKGTVTAGHQTEIDLVATPKSASGTAQEPIITGTGNLSFSIDGVNLGTIGPVPFTNLKFNMASKMLEGAETFTMGQDYTLSNIFGCGFDLVLKKNSTLTTSMSINPNGTTQGSANFAGGCAFNSPYKDTGGKAVGLSITQMEIDLAGNISATGTATIPQAGISFVGMDVQSGTASGKWSFARKAGQKAQFSIGFDTVTASVAIPGLSAFDLGNLKLTVTGLDVDIDGKTTFTKATLASNNTVTVTLPAPANMELNMRSITLSEQGGKISGLTAEGGITLPSTFSAVDTSGGASPVPVQIPNMSLVLVNGVPQISISKLEHELDAFWNGFQLQIPSSPTLPPFEIDLWTNYAFPDEVDAYGKALPASWQGIFIKQATIKLPASWGAGQSIAVKNFAIGPDGGIYGTVTYTGGPNSPVKYQIPGFASTLTSLSLTFNAGDIVAGSGAGTIAVSDFGVNLGVAISFSTSGQTVVSVDTTQPIPIQSLGMQLQIDQGTVTYDGNGQGSITLSGALSFGDNPPGGLSGLADASLAVSGLTVNSQGHVSISSVMLNCPNMQPVSVGPLSLTLQQFGFGQNSNGAWWVTFTGDVGVSGLPISGQVGFNGLTVTQGLNGAPPSVSLPSNIQISTDMDGVASIDVDISHSTYPVAGQKPAQPDWQAYNGPPIDVYSGLASVSLECFGSGGPGIGLNFMASANSFFILGDVELGSSGIVLGETPFSLFGFRGGFGINVEPDTPGATGIPSIDYQLIPVAPGGAGNDIFVAGVRLGLSDGFTLWGDLTLILDIGSDFSIDLNGALYCVQEGIGDPIGQVPQDRVVTGDIVFSMPNGNPTLSANAQANFYLPDNATYTSSNIAAYATGSLWFNLDHNGLALNVGGTITPANLGTGSAPSIQNPVTIYLFGVQGPAGAVNIQIPAPAGVYPIQAAATFGYSKSWSGSWGVFGGNINWSASASVGAWFWGAVTLPPTGPFGVYAGLGLSGSADFGVTGPFGLNVNVGAGFGGVLDASVTTNGANFSGDLGVTIHVCGFKHTFQLGFSWP